MRRPKCYLQILFFPFFVWPVMCSYAGQVNFVTYYPAPSGAYNTVYLQAQGVGATPCVDGGGAPANNGMLFVNANESLVVCNNGKAQVYPQQCYNSFCSFKTINGACVPPPSCSYSGYAQVGGFSDTVQIDGTYSITSIACCGGQ